MLMQSTRSGLRRLAGRDRWEVVGFLREHAEHNAFLLGQVAANGLGRESLAGSFAGFWRDGALAGVVCVGSNLVLSQPCGEDALVAFAHFARRTGYQVRVVVGPDRLVDRFMGHYGRNPEAITLERARQSLYRVDYTELAGDDECPELAPADVREVEQLLRLDVAMVTEELGFDPFSADMRGYRRGWLKRIRDGRTWVVRADGEGVIFKVDQSAAGPDAVQLSGVYTVPGHRRRGIARRAIAEMCDRLLAEVPIVTLYVHADNVPAVGLYEALGFRLVGRVRSVWFR